MRLTVPLSLCVWLFHLIVLCTAQQSQTKSSALLNTAKRLFQVALGQTPVEDLLARDEADRAAGVTRITRNNYEKLLTDGEWVILVHGKDPLSPRFLEMHTNASLASQELSLGIKWGRVDLIEETYISMRWLLFRPPYLVFISNSGHDLRFLSPRHVHPEGDRLLEFVEKKQWKDLPIWNSRYGPDGDRAWIVEWYLIITTRVSKIIDSIPPVFWVFIVSIVADLTMRWLHARPRTTTNTTSTPQHHDSSNSPTSSGVPLSKT